MAATTPYSGINGTISVGGTTYNILDWEITQTSEVKDSTDSGDVATSVAWGKNEPSGVKRWSGSFNMVMNDGVASIVVGTEAEIIAKMDGTDNLTGTAIITSVGTNAQVIEGEVVKQGIEFVGTGALVETNS